jgi:pimeloyl-ACP methyl ester carboxylesterase
MTEHRTLAVNGIQMHIAEAGTGPLVLLVHGWPELWYAWRHQLTALAAAGFHAVAPDLRGFGATEAPADVDQYDIMHVVGDLVALVAQLGEKQAIIIGHDWGASIAWSAALLRPDLFPAVVGMSVPQRPRSSQPPVQILRKAGATDHYWLYFQTPGVAEAELEANVPHTMRCILYGISGDVPTNSEKTPLAVSSGRGFLDGMVTPERLPAWLHERDIAAYVVAYQRSGFRGGLNLYRNLDRNWELTAPWHGVQIRQPALFIGGLRDPVNAGPKGAGAIEHMKLAVPNVKILMLEGAGHWLQQEQPQQVNAALLEFLRSEAVQKVL